MANRGSIDACVRDTNGWLSTVFRDLNGPLASLAASVVRLNPASWTVKDSKGHLADGHIAIAREL